MIGTNDAIDNYDMADAPARRGALIDTARANTDPNVQGYVLLGTQWYVVPQPLL